jgi:hypothetical protein
MTYFAGSLSANSCREGTYTGTTQRHNKITKKLQDFQLFEAVVSMLTLDQMILFP